MLGSRKGQNLLWIVPEAHGGIQSYSAALWPAVSEACAAAGWRTLDPMFLDTASDPRSLKRALREIARLAPDLIPNVIHVQHEYGLFGRKVPPFYRFPRWIKQLRKVCPRAKIVATAHTVLPPDFRYPSVLTGLKGLATRVANAALAPYWQQTWGPNTWGLTDGVIVHSRHQQGPVEASGCPAVAVIPHFVPAARGATAGTAVSAPPPGAADATPLVVVFGFVTPEKGQDLLIRALARMKTRADLMIAGGLRRPEDRAYYAHCQRLSRACGLTDRVRFAGYIPDDRLDQLYADASLVVAPFRSTSGSGSLAHALARGAATLTSDLPLNLEIGEREPGSLAFFRAGDANDCARKIDELLSDAPAREALRGAARRYAAANTPARIAGLHLEFYQKVGPTFWSSSAS
jgi:glycosyltransferase involved in cell wall biosynthesis